MSDTLEKIKEIIIDKLGVDQNKITDDAKFIDDLGADSLDTVELIMQFEEEFDGVQTLVESKKKAWVKENYPNQYKQYTDNIYDNELREYAMQIKEETGKDMTDKQMRAWIKENHPDRYVKTKKEKIQDQNKNADGYHFRSGEAETIKFLKKDFAQRKTSF